MGYHAVSAAGLFIEFSNVSVVETKEISENLYIDLDEKGNLVSMTIEHAKEKQVFQKCFFCKWKRQAPNESINWTGHSPASYEVRIPTQ
ncbi:MAG: DUF2283 domain-containing protein [Nitrospirae bacterium]|nr:DUF2283 domain-containing protein [Nitrospirota bacterium]